MGRNDGRKRVKQKRHAFLEKRGKPYKDNTMKKDTNASKIIAGAVADITASAGKSVDNPAWHLRPTTLAALVADLTDAAGAKPRALRAQALAMLTSHVGEKEAAAMVAAEDTI